MLHYDYIYMFTCNHVFIMYFVHNQIDPMNWEKKKEKKEIKLTRLLQSSLMHWWFETLITDFSFSSYIKKVSNIFKLAAINYNQITLQYLLQRLVRLKNKCKNRLFIWFKKLPFSALQRLTETVNHKGS